MKKITFLLIALCAVSLLATAQDSTGKISLSIRFSPTANYKINFLGLSNYTAGNGDKVNAEASIGSFSADVIGRYKLNEQLTSRFGIGYGSLKLKGNSKYTYSNSETDEYEANLTQNRMIFTPALERHFNSNKLEILTGIGLPVCLIGKTTASAKSTYTYFNPSSTDVYEENYEVPGGFGIGLQSFAGFNFYITNNFAIGTEISYGIGYIKYGGRVIINETNNGSVNSYASDELKVNGLGTTLLNGSLVLTVHL